MVQKKRWIRSHHAWVKKIFTPVLRWIAMSRYHCKLEKFPSDGRSYLILCNHQTDFDQFLVSLLFDMPLYFVAMEDLFSRGLFSRFIEWAAAPIPILKASSDRKAVMDCIRVTRQGGSVVLFPEGNRTYSGKTCYIKPQVASLARLLKLPIAIVRLEGGFGIKPRWADTIRSGTMRAGVRCVMEPEEYQSLNKEALYERICRELDVDDTKNAPWYMSNWSAEGLERVLYVCPKAGLVTYSTKGTVLTCEHCGQRYRYRPDLCLEAMGGETDVRTITDWYARQETFIRSLDLTAYSDNPAFCDSVDVCRVILYRRKKMWRRQSKLCLYGDRMVLSDASGRVLWHFDDVQAMACIADHRLNVYYKENLFQIKGDTHFNALKYCNFYYHYKNSKEGNNYGEFQFLGL